MSAAQCCAAATNAAQGHSSLAALRAEHERERQRLEEQQRLAMAALRAKHEEADAREAEAAARLDAEFRALLPFLGDDIFVLIAAELDARMLGRLACTAPRFWRPSVPDPAHKGSAPAELWSVVAEGARRRLAAQSEQVRGWVSRETSGGSWLRTLGEAEKLQRPLHFTEHHLAVELSEQGTVATRPGSGWRGAVCGGHEMRRGRHYTTFTLRSRHSMMGVIRPDFNQMYHNSAFASPHAWMLNRVDGQHYHAGRGSNWEGQPEELKDDDVVVRLPAPPSARHATPPTLLCAPQGLLLDCDAATLTVWVNGERKGVMARPGMTDDDGEPVGRLEGPLRWAVDLDGAVKIDGPLPLPEDA